MELLPKPVGVLDAIYNRRSVRAYTAEKLDEATIRTLLDAAVQAPTAVHLEPWAFVIVQDAPALKRYSDLAKASKLSELGSTRDRAQVISIPRSSEAFDRFSDPDFNIFYDATTLIVVCARPLGPYVVADCWLAAANLMLAAQGLGLATCPIGFAIPVLNTIEVKSELGIPPEATAVAPIIVGVPRGHAPAVSRKKPEIWCWRR